MLRLGALAAVLGGLFGTAPEEAARRPVEHSETLDFSISRRRLAGAVVVEPSPLVVAVGTARSRVAAGRGHQVGGASWYQFRPGTCAHRTLPKGTVVTVTNRANGRSAICRVADRGPYIDGRIIDLDHSVFSAIAPVSAGVIQVRLEW